LHLTTVFRWLLFPVSAIESPNAITAGTVSFGGNFMRALVLQKRKSNTRLSRYMEEEEEEGIFSPSLLLLLSTSTICLAD
jgi:hypothetical protein